MAVIFHPVPSAQTVRSGYDYHVPTEAGDVSQCGIHLTGWKERMAHSCWLLEVTGRVC